MLEGVSCVPLGPVPNQVSYSRWANHQLLFINLLACGSTICSSDILKCKAEVKTTLNSVGKETLLSTKKAVELKTSECQDGASTSRCT